MASSARPFTQDMPPTGGYGKIQWERIRLKTLFTPGLTIGLWAGATLIGGYVYFLTHKNILREEIEMRSARHAMIPMLLAERDRAYLKQLNKNREIEKELMKNVPEWEVGTYFREPIYITQPNKWHDVSYWEFMAHSDYWDACFRPLRRHFT